MQKPLLIFSGGFYSYLLLFQCFGLSQLLLLPRTGFAATQISPLFRRHETIRQGTALTVVDVDGLH